MWGRASPGSEQDTILHYTLLCTRSGRGALTSMFDADATHKVVSVVVEHDRHSSRLMLL